LGYVSLAKQRKVPGVRVMILNKKVKLTSTSQNPLTL